MKSGRIFDTKEFAVYDGAGIRVTYFLQGCPMRCEWCHNPEGQAMVGGKVRTSGEVIREILDYASLWQDCEGGVTFSGGEPLMQAGFLLEIMEGIGNVSKAVETSAAVSKEIFRSVLNKVDFAYVDLKIYEETLHTRYTGVGNQLILENIRWLAETDIPCIIRIPMISGVSATEVNYRQTASFLAGLSRKLPVELLPYNTLTKAKYDAVGREYSIQFPEEGTVCDDVQIFRRCGLTCRIL